MKKYIRASLSPSTPSWLTREFANSRKFYTGLKSKLIDKYRVSLDTAEFTHDIPASGSYLTFYLLNTDYGQTIYCPGVNDDASENINGRYRKLGSIAKSKLAGMSSDIVYLDLDDPNNVHPKKDRYRDPRYSYRHNDRGDYAGQYRRRPYLGDGKYGDEGWSTTGMRPSNEGKARDKSGYVVPDPEDLIARYYEKFPTRITDKVDALYDKMIDVQQKLTSTDFRKSREYGSSDLRNAYSTFGSAVSKYQELLHKLENSNKSSNSWLRWSASDFSKQISYIQDNLDDIETYLDRFAEDPEF